jgi:hypothetical protein
MLRTLEFATHGSETAVIARGAAAELGSLALTQPKPEEGPFRTPAR